jgi:hypothetical protein
MANTHLASESLHVLLSKNIPHQPLALTLAELTANTSHNTRSILPTVLQDRQGIIDLRGDIGLRN